MFARLEKGSFVTFRIFVSAPHCSEIQVPVFTSLPDLVPDTAFTEAIDESSDSTYSSNSCIELLQISKAEPFTQG